ncbi:MAG: hypothetical protein HWE10_07530 [Gammaproteobacteria bacterium]|nr:hypothetical protein [Gammaproteobacteria bacterium]
MSKPKIGIGNSQPKWILHIANRPEVEGFQHDIFRTLNTAEAADIIKQTSNHWRKVFSIMAKISFALFDTQCSTWQEYRDNKLLTDEGFEAVSFESFHQSAATKETFSIICGFTYAESQLDMASLISHQKFEKIKMSSRHPLMVTPYFDWRQLNNELLEVVISILRHKLKK